MDEVTDAARGAAGEGTPTPVDLRWLGAAARVVAVHPSLWRIGVRQALALAPRGWWRRRPFLPLPAPDYVRFRLQTAYGGAGDRAPDPADLLTYLRWCRTMR